MLTRIINLCEKQGFLRRIVYPNLPTLEFYAVEAVGALLQENLRTEWFNTVVINRDLAVFPSSDSFADTYNYAKYTCMDTAPFAVTRCLEMKQSPQDYLPKSERMTFPDRFRVRTVLECCVFVTPSTATQFFHQWQRERRMWWRKFSASPGRYILTDVKDTGDLEQNVEILAKYQWGNELVETLTLTKGDHKLSTEQLQVKEGKKTVQVQSVVSKICVSTMLLNALCDAFDEPDFHGSPRPLLRLHRKLAPYKISFSISSSAQKAVVEELRDLALYLCRQLRKNHVSCLLGPFSHKHTLETQWRHYDQMGVPYNVLLNENTLKTGIAQLRSRDTTLKEQVHISNLVPYVEQLFKNY